MQELFVKNVPEEYTSRLKREINLIEKNNFKPIFQSVKEILQLAKGIPHLLRGSAGGSLVCWLMGFTDFDPVTYNFKSSRFMSEYRSDFPDIDLDFRYDQRDSLLEKVFEKYGTRVARVATHLHYSPRGALRQAIREFGYHKYLPKRFNLDSVAGLFREQILARAKELDGTRKLTAKHCGGVVIFPDEVPKNLLLSPGQLRLDKDEVEEAGLAKIDLLGNHGLAQLFDISSLPLHEYPETDSDTSKLLCAGNTLGITFGESPAMRRLFMDLAPRTREETVLALALIRPLPSADGRKNKIVTHWQKERNTKGFLVYDDDGIEYIQRLLNCSEDLAEYWRKCFAKKNEQKILEFEKLVKRDVSDLRNYALYSFCRAHAFAYGYLVWALAYQKAKDPKAFWHSTLNHASSMYRPWVHFQEAKKAGLIFTTLPGKKWIRSGDELSAGVISGGDGWQQYKRKKVWLSNRFMPGMYLHGGEFRGLVATGRHHSLYGRSVTFLTIGVGKDEFCDLTLDGLFDWEEFDVVRGKGEVCPRGIKVKEINGEKV